MPNHSHNSWICCSINYVLAGIGTISFWCACFWESCWFCNSFDIQKNRPAPLSCRWWWRKASIITTHARRQRGITLYVFFLSSFLTLIRFDTLQAISRYSYACKSMCDTLVFISFATHLCRSALRSFERRVAYSNVGYDRILIFWTLLYLHFLMG